MKQLTHDELRVLRWRRDKAHPDLLREADVRYGLVARRLRERGYLTPSPEGYQLTDKGRTALAASK